MDIPELGTGRNRDAAAPRQIRARYPSRCAHCHQQIATGDVAWWDKQHRTMVHPECYDAQGERHVDQCVAEDGWWETEPPSEEKQYPLFTASGDLEVTPF